MNKVRVKADVDYANILEWIIELADDDDTISVRIHRGNVCQYRFCLFSDNGKHVMAGICDYVSELQEILGMDTILSVTTDGEEATCFLTNYVDEDDFEAQVASMFKMFGILLRRV